MKRVFETAEREEVRNSIFWELSTVLTVISHSYGESLFFPQPTWRSDTSTDFQAKRLNRHGLMQGCAFCSKNPNFSKCLTPKTGQSITNSYHYHYNNLLDNVWPVIQHCWLYVRTQTLQTCRPGIYQSVCIDPATETIPVLRNLFFFC